LVFINSGLYHNGRITSKPPVGKGAAPEECKNKSLIVPPYPIILNCIICPDGQPSIRKIKDQNMGKIKSALELALEKTADLKTDKSAVKKNMIIREGKVAVSGFLEDASRSDLHEKLQSYKGEELEWFKTGVVDTILANLTLPRLEADLNRLTPLSEALSLLSGSKEEVEGTFEQLNQLFSQYLSNLDQLEDALKKQYEPQLRQKEMKLRQQTGQDVQLRPEQDPEFMQILSEQLSRMDQQYNDVLKQAKEQIKQGIIQ